LGIAGELVFVEQIGMSIAINISELEVGSVQVLVVLDLSRSLGHAIFASKPSPGLTGRRHADVVCSSRPCDIGEMVGIVEGQPSKALGAPFSARRVGDHLCLPVVLFGILFPAIMPYFEGTSLEVGDTNDVVLSIAIPIGYVQLSALETRFDHRLGLRRCPGGRCVKVVLLERVLVDKHVDLAMH
jgi:hypothetical protein